ncbi:hypothetical protein HK104_003481 [Borealophlyctis nickersoniae]|nr:hypothetical protein HK104_003481 [Borealophlyctis nickersoniae]
MPVQPVPRKQSHLATERAKYREKLRRTNAAIRIQTWYRSLSAARKYHSLRKVNVFPVEILEDIFSRLPPIQCFRLAVRFRFLKLRDKMIPKIRAASMNNASRKGQIALLDWWKKDSNPK